jgi:hypothetical protein
MKDVNKMIADPTFQGFVTQDVVNNLRSVGDEFAQAEHDDKVSERLGRKYHNALTAYQNALADSPYSPVGVTIDPTAYDVMMREKMNDELSRVRTEVSRILKHLGGVLSLTPDEGEE